jgi:hypothetical protein
MFELNLIKDKARARQRRRVIFLTITSVCFLAGLCSLFVASLYLSELNATKDAARQADAKNAELNVKKVENDTNEPIFKKRRNEVIKAWLEDTEFLSKRPYYSTVLKILSTERPGSPYWYTIIEFRLLAQGNPAGVAAGGPALPQTPKLLLPRGLRISGMISITESDVKTQQALKRMDERMNDREGFVALVGPVTSVLDPAAANKFGGGGGQGGGEASRWNEFTMTTSNSGSGGYGQ